MSAGNILLDFAWVAFDTNGLVRVVIYRSFPSRWLDGWEIEWCGLVTYAQVAKHRMPSVICNLQDRSPLYSIMPT